MENYLLKNSTAKDIYNKYAKDMPIIDYHSHISVKEIYENNIYDNIGEIMLSRDHYKWRLMRSHGIPEKYITGSATYKDKFKMWSKTMDSIVGNPVYQWTNLELEIFFNYKKGLNSKNWEEVWEHCNQYIKEQELTPYKIMEMLNVQALFITEKSDADLSYYNKLNHNIKIIPSLRIDSLLSIDRLYELEGSLDLYFEQISEVFREFEKFGCRTIDYGVNKFYFKNAEKSEISNILKKIKDNTDINDKESIMIKSEILMYIMKETINREWVFQFHIGGKGNISLKAKNELQPNSGFSYIETQEGLVNELIEFYNCLEVNTGIPKTIIFNLDDSIIERIAVFLNGFTYGNRIPGKMQLGAAWWFNDHVKGIEHQLEVYKNYMNLGDFIGMLTDSRSILSLSRHDFFRRILCNKFSEWIENGEIINDKEIINTTIENITYYNSKKYFQIK